MNSITPISQTERLNYKYLIEHVQKQSTWSRIYYLFVNCYHVKQKITGIVFCISLQHMRLSLSCNYALDWQDLRSKRGNVFRKLYQRLEKTKKKLHVNFGNTKGTFTLAVTYHENYTPFIPRLKNDMSQRSGKTVPGS